MEEYRVDGETTDEQSRKDRREQEAVIKKNEWTKDANRVAGRAVLLCLYAFMLPLQLLYQCTVWRVHHVNINVNALKRKCEKKKADSLRSPASDLVPSHSLIGYSGGDQANRGRRLRQRVTGDPAIFPTTHRHMDRHMLGTIFYISLSQLNLGYIHCSSPRI